MRFADLTPRQREIADLVSLRTPRREIAMRLSRPGRSPMSIRTVDAHIRAIVALLPRDELASSRRIRNWVNAQRLPEIAYAGQDNAHTHA
jgi:DNA-binding NarL/FixJ family response regulator